MADQTQRLEVATVRAEVGSSILYRFSNDAVDAAVIPTESGDITNLKKVILDIQTEGAEKISFATTIYPTTAAGIAATTNGAIFLVASSDTDEIYAVYSNNAGTALDTGKRAISGAAVTAAVNTATTAATAAQTAADTATARVAGFHSPSATDPVTRDDGTALQIGDTYFNTASQSSRIYTNTGWAAQALDAAYLSANQGASRVGTAAGVTVEAALAAKEPVIAAGTALQYWRGDKTFQTLNKAAVGLANVDNTADINKPVSTATQAAINGISFLQSGTGAVTRTLQSKMRDFVSVKDFGALGDGVTDDTASINKALATGNLIYFPAGQYIVTAPLTTAPGGGIQGSGEKTQFVRKFNGGQVIRHPGGNQLGSPIILRDFCITRDASITVASGDTGIDIGYSTAWGGRGEISNILILQQWDGFKWTGGAMNLMQNIQVLEGKGHGFLGVNARGELSGCLSQYNAGNGYFFYAQNAGETGVQLTSCGTFGNQGWGYLFDAAAGVTGANVYMKGVTSSFDGLGGMGFYNGYIQVFFEQILIESAGNAHTSTPAFAVHNDAVGLYMVNVQQIEGSNFYIQNCNGMGAFFNNVKGCLLSNINCYNNGIGGLGGTNASGLYFAGGNSDFSINGLIANFGSSQINDLVFADSGDQIDLSGSINFRTISGNGNGICFKTSARTAASRTVASANPLPVPPYGSVFLVSGSVNFATIPPYFEGRRITLLFDSSNVVYSNGNIKLKANTAVSAGDTIDLVSDGVSWYRAG